MKAINLNLGMTEYAVGGNEENPIRINLLDVNLLKRLRAAEQKINAAMEQYQGRDDLTAEEMIGFDEMFRAIMTETFGQDICACAFGDMNCMTPVPDGSGGEIPVFRAFLESFLPVLEADIRAANPQPVVNPKVQQYTAPVITKKTPVSGLPDVSSLSKEQKAALLAELMA